MLGSEETVECAGQVVVQDQEWGSAQGQDIMENTGDYKDIQLMCHETNKPSSLTNNA